ncbi:protein transport protein Sec24-like At4g32640 isoform X2 [Macadamia integrifolia]|uniref:protein transport protein Sec24-like At4g32640 isoform X2 n=1 Tax=Macadamia integrifolia TaxID=60698 RepID=UPI001C500F79|nr:protein transport protein Sec24-like At4g32640 isoform X2 [Macadamia integrifolia]
MASPVPSGVPRPGGNPVPPPPNYNMQRTSADSVAAGMQNMQINRQSSMPNQPVPRPTPFAPPPFAATSTSSAPPALYPGSAPVSRSGPPPVGFPRTGPPSTGPPYAASVTPSGPPALASRPPPPTALTSSPLMAGPVVPSSTAPTVQGPMSNGQPAFASGPQRFPPSGSAQQPPVGPPSGGLSDRVPQAPPSIRPFPASYAGSASHGPPSQLVPPPPKPYPTASQPLQPFSAGQGMPPPPTHYPTASQPLRSFSAGQGMPPPPTHYPTASQPLRSFSAAQGMPPPPTHYPTASQPLQSFSAAQGMPPPPMHYPTASQPLRSFSAAQGMPPPPTHYPTASQPLQSFSAAQGMPTPPMESPYGAQTWAMQQRQVTPGPGTQPPRMFGVAPPPPPNHPMTSMPPATSHLPVAGAPAAGPSKIDPNQIPRPVPGSSVIIFETRQGNQASVPPPATSNYIVKDTGNCSPRFMRCTINQIPCTSDLLMTSGMQLALMVQPLALPHQSEDPIQVVDFGDSGPVRCSRCKGYINPFMKFIDQGRHFICNLCGFTDETPREYHCNLGPDGRRRDADERPELCRGTVEFVAPKEYMVRDPMPAVFFFLIDVSMNAIQTGGTAAACSAINQVIGDLPEGPRTFVGIATFDSTIHFYNLKRVLQQPLMLIVPDVQDVYTPLQTDVIVQLSECRQHLEQLLENIPTMFHSNKVADSAFGAAIKAAFLAMKSTGGKLLVFQSVLPSIGVGALSAREAEGRVNVSAGEKEAHKLLQPADKTLKTMAIEFAEYQVCVDVFITTQSYVDIASISVVPKNTGGQVYYYYPFSVLCDSAKLYNDLRWNVTRPQGFEAVMRVRCSQGLQVQDYSGNYCKRIPTDVDLPGIDCDKTIMVTLKHDDKFQDGAECGFQCALLYTTMYGQRRIRVTTLSLPCTTVLSNLFRSADLDTQFACFLKQAASETPISSIPQIREQMTNFCINILYSYRKYCATVSSSGQLILPEALKLLPLYILALVKSIGLRTDGRIDDRSYWISRVSTISIPLVVPFVYPSLIAIHDLVSKETDGSLIPPSKPLSSDNITDDGIFLLENGEDCLIYVGNSVNSDILQQIFGISSINEIPTQFVLQQYDNPLSKKLNEVVNEIRRQRCSYLRLRLCKKGDPSGMLFFSYMVEDKTPSGLSYVEFLVHTHRQIQTKMV